MCSLKISPLLLVVVVFSVVVAFNLFVHIISLALPDRTPVDYNKIKKIKKHTTCKINLRSKDSFFSSIGLRWKYFNLI